MSRYTGRHLGPYTRIQRFRNRAQRRALLGHEVRLVLERAERLDLDLANDNDREILVARLVDALEPNP